jgi:hypothetical protein
MAKKLSRDEVEEIVRVAREKGERPDLRGVDLKELDLSGADLGEADFFGADLSGAQLVKANLNGASLVGAILIETNLSRAKIRGADLSGAFLNGADLSGVQLIGADLSAANFTGANLSGTYLNAAYLNQTVLSGADLSGARIGRTTFADTILSQVKGLETLRHRGPSSIGIDTLFRSAGQIPQIFLERAGVPPQLIACLEKIRVPKCPYTQESLDEWIRNSRKRLVIINKRLAHYQIQAAGYGELNTPFSIAHEIDSARREKQEVEAEIAEWQRLKDVYY